MNILSWIIFGLIAGAFAKFFSKKKLSLIGTILLGIAGSLFGGWLGDMMGLGSSGDFSLGSFATAILGAMLLIFLYRAITDQR